MRRIELDEFYEFDKQISEELKNNEMTAKNKNISIENGLEISLKVLDELKKHKLNKDVTIGTFTNCRECGLTFRVFGKEKSFTWCVYEHRNSDEIIINGKEGYISFNGDLPYNGDSKYSYLHSFNHGEFTECADKLAEIINNFNN